MSVHTIKDGDLILIGIREPTEGGSAFRDNAERGFAEHLGVKITVLIVVDALGLFEVLRAESK